MGKAFGLVLMLIALWVGLEIYLKGTQGALGGIFAPVESVRGDDGPGAIGLAPAAQSADIPVERARRVPITERVREAVTEDIERGFERNRGH